MGQTDRKYRKVSLLSVGSEACKRAIDPSIEHHASQATGRGVTRDLQRMKGLRRYRVRQRRAKMVLRLGDSGEGGNRSLYNDELR
jgi:hypothetical protein